MPENPRIEELRRRVLADPASIAFAALAEEFRRVGALQDAIDTCRTGLQRHPAYLSARVTLGRALIETGDYDGAREEFETVLRSAPENLAAIRGLAQITERLGHSTEMDPHLAELMRQEAERIASAPPPPTPIPVAVVEALPPEPEPEPQPERHAEPEAEVFAPPVPQFAAAPEPEVFTPHQSQFVAGPETEPAPEPEPDVILHTAALRESTIDIGIAPDPEPDPAVLATLARLERLLAAVETARHA